MNMKITPNLNDTVGQCEVVIPIILKIPIYVEPVVLQLSQTSFTQPLSVQQ